MPEYLAPGVYVEEVSFRSKSIEGVSTTTTGFVGPCRYGPIELTPDVITSLGEFERIYGDGQQMNFTGEGVTDNHIWHGARAFFEEGGRRLYIARVYRPAGVEPADGEPDLRGVATGQIAGSTGSIEIAARFPGEYGNLRVRFTLTFGSNALADSGGVAAVRGLFENDIVAVRRQSSPPGTFNTTFARAVLDTTVTPPAWNFEPATGPLIALSSLNPSANPAFSDRIQTVTLTVTVFPHDPNQSTQVWAGLALDRRHLINGSTDSVEEFFEASPSTLGLARSLPIVVTNTGATNGLALLQAIFDADVTRRATANLPAQPNLQTSLLTDNSSDLSRSYDVLLEGGNDGLRPESGEYQGFAQPNSTIKTGLRALEDIDDISIVAAPGSTFLYNDQPGDAATTIGMLINHATQMRYRIAVIDSGPGQSVADVRAMRAQFDSTYAAFYYPWVSVMDPITRREIQLPPSGFVCGIYARNDINRGVYKAPANEVVNLSIGFETLLNKGQQDVLNPLGINCFRFFEGRGNRLWGARTMSSDPEWKYVNLRRYFAYLEHSIDKGTQWAVFEPNGDRLWANVRRTIEDFLLNEWQNGALLGDKPEKAYFVRCDRSTMTQNDLDNGRMVCLIGVSPLRPAEFVIFRIGQWTSDRR